MVPPAQRGAENESSPAKSQRHQHPQRSSTTLLIPSPEPGTGKSLDLEGYEGRTSEVEGGWGARGVCPYLLRMKQLSIIQLYSV